MSGQRRVFVYVFGDQTQDITDNVLSLLQSRNDPLVVDFLERSCAVLKLETARLPPGQQARCPRFSTIADLLSACRSRTLNPCIVQALTCISQLGLFIRQHSSGCQVYPTPENSCLSGICTGAFAAAAVSCAHSAPSLLLPALHAVAVAVRVGALAWDVAERIMKYDETSIATTGSDSWSRAVTASSVKALADGILRYTSNTSLPITNVPYVSAVVGPTQATVSGPPDVLSEFFTSAVGKSVAPVSASLRITAPYHSAVLYSDLDVEQVLDGVPKHSMPRPCIPIISTSTESQTTTTPIANLHEALKQATRDCLMRSIALDQLPNRIAEHVKAVAKSSPTEISEIFIEPVISHITDSLLTPIRHLLPRESYHVQEKTFKVLEQPKTILSNEIPDVPSVGTSKSPIAILSASGRFPGNADTMDHFWDILYNGIDTCEMVPPSRWNASTHVGDTSIKNVSGTGYGCWLHQAGQFDTTFFNISPREASRVDPAQRLALMTAAEALEKAGIVPERTSSTLRHRVGVWYGSCSTDWLETNSAQDIDAYFIPGGGRAFIAGRINYHFKFTGPSYTIDTACSSSLAALHLACNALWNGEVDTAIVGGTNMATNPDITTGLDRGHFLSRTGNCKTFDDEADGYCRGEAAVTIILKRLSDAQKDRDPIEACILGVATNHNAEANSITRPHTAAQKELFEHILAETMVDPNDISYVEMHGTGTQAGDAGETASITSTLSPLTARGSPTRTTSNPLYLGAAKANVGHGGAASGVTSIAKVLMMMKHSKIPPHIGVKTRINQKLPNLKAHNTHIATTPVSWSRPEGGSRRILLNNFSAAGGNTSILLEDAPVCSEITGLDPRCRHIVVISSKSTDSLVSNLENLIHWFDNKAPQNDPNLLAKLSYTTTARRMHYRYRIAVTASSVPQLRSSLQKHLQMLCSTDKALPIPSKPPGVVFTFTGQGALYAGMGAELYVQFASFKANMQRYDHMCVQMGFPSILPVFEQEGYFYQASLTCLQLAQVSFQMALCKLWELFGVKPTAVVGHSLGDYAALYAAGALSQSDVLHLVGKRSQLMEENLPQGTHAMLVVKAEEAAVLAAASTSGCRDVEVACRNNKYNTVLGGTISSIKTTRAVLEAKGFRCHVLETKHAFHTSQVEPILALFRTVTKGVVTRRPNIPVISATLGKVLWESSDLGDDYFVDHCRQPVNFMQAVCAAKADGVLDNRTIAIEIGPSPVVASMAKELVGPTMQTFASAHKTIDPWNLLTTAFSGLYLAGVNIDWNAYHEGFHECHQVLQIPTYAWNLKEYWMQYTNDWTLRKGDAACVARSTSLANSSIYTVVKNTLHTNSGGQAIIDIDLNSDDEVHSMAEGHRVYGVPLCTPSLYADIAQMIGNYVQQLGSIEDSVFTTEVAEMHIQSALVANEVGNKQVLRTEANLDTAKRTLFCTFSTLTENKKGIEQHAECQIRFVEIDAVRTQFRESAKEATLRMKALEAQVGKDDSTFRYNRSMIYRSIGQIARFDSRYRGLSSVTINNDTFEASGTAIFKDIPDSGKWFSNPGFLDSISQLPGFVMNANDSVDLEKDLYVNHGWDSMKIFTSKLDPNMTYHLYVKMKQSKDDLWVGDTIIFDQDQTFVGILQGCELQRVPKRVMELIINSAMRKVSNGSAHDKKRSQSQPPDATPMDRRAASRIKKKTAVIDTKEIAADQWPVAIKILAEESGLEESELTGTVKLNDIGIDSLLSLVITSRLREELDIDLPTNALFEECLTIGDIRKRVSGNTVLSTDNLNLLECDFTGATSISISPSESITMDSLESMSSASESPVGSFDEKRTHSNFSAVRVGVHHYDTDLETSTPTRACREIPPAWSMFIQGSSSQSEDALFLFPDGCGTATSYLCLPSISPDRALVAFNSPFAKKPDRMYDWSFQDVLQSYVAGLRARQAHGPYNLGGWSAGGILAYAVAQELIAAGEEVASLTLIDSPAPIKGLDILPERFYEHCTKTGIFRSEMRRGAQQVEPPEWLISHFRAVTAMLHDYHAPPMSPEVASKMRVNIIWAGKTAFDSVRYPPLPPAMAEGEDCEGMKFLTETREDCGPGDWVKLLPGATITTNVVEDEHHFSIMRGDGAEKVVQYIRTGL